MASTDEIHAKIVGPMRALFRVPFGIDDPERALVEYTKALKSASGDAMAQAWDRLVATHKRRDWPTISEIISAIDHTESLSAPKRNSAESPGSVHPARINTPPEMRGVQLMDSSLRSKPEWNSFLETIHPTIEHNFFVQAERVGDGIEVPNDFRREYIVNNYSEAMKAHFKKGVHVSVNKSRKYRELPNLGAR